MNEFLTKYAMKNVWCDPTRDHQQAFRTVRLSDKRGDMVMVNIHRDTVRLPDNHSRWMVYQIGGVNINRLNLPTEKWRWYRIDELCEQRQMLIDVYTDNGIQLNKSETYLFYSHGGALFIAIKHNAYYCDFDTASVYVRFYSGRSISESRQGVYGKVRVFSEQMEDTSHIGLLKNTIDTLKVHHDGAVFCYVNGRYVDEVSLKYIRRNDYVEVFFDPSVYKIVDLDIKDLHVFNSEKDGERKYLIHPPKDGLSQIDYVDDVDVYLVRKVSGRVGGIYYHHSQSKWMRQVTHRDYSIPVNKVRSFFEAHTADKTHLNEAEYPEQHWEQMEQLTLRLFVRRPAIERPLVDTAERLLELYRLDDDQIVRCLAGIDSNLHFWKASYLEQSSYVKFMGLMPDDIYQPMFGVEDASSEQKEAVQELVGQVFGYHGCSKILSDTPSLVRSVGNVKCAPLSYEFWFDSTVYEYDGEGKLRGYYPSSAEDMYRVVNNDCAMIDALVGKPGKNFARSDESTTFTVLNGYNTRLFTCTIRRGEPQWDWVDVTYSDKLSDLGKWTLDARGNKVWSWTIDTKTTLGIVVTDQTFVQRDFELDGHNGLLSFLLTEDSDSSVIHIPLRDLDIWLNGYALQPGLDYTVQWPRVVIHNVSYLRNDIEKQHVVYRSYGLPDLEFNAGQDTEIGWVEHDRLSRDGVINFYDSRVIRITADGRTLHRDQVVFDEDTGTYKVSGVRNGAPYSVKCITHPLRDVFKDDQKAKDEDDKRNSLVSDFLTSKLPANQYPSVDFTDRRYPVISCFANRIYHELKQGTNLPPWIEGRYSEQDIAEFYSNRTWLLSFDIAQTDFNPQRVVIVPHWYSNPVSLPYYRYVLFKRIIKHFLNVEIDTSVYVTIDEVNRLP